MAALNLTVPLLERDRIGLSPVLAVTHTGVAALCVALALVDRPEPSPLAALDRRPFVRRSHHDAPHR